MCAAELASSIGCRDRALPSVHVVSCVATPIQLRIAQLKVAMPTQNPVPSLPAVSVVIPFFNSAGTIARAVESVLQQTWAPSEILIVDDGSEDSEYHQLEALAAHPLIEVLRLEVNQGAAAARNRGWEAASGEWIAFLDSDDSWAPAKLETQLRAIQRDPRAAEEAVLVGTDALVLGAESKTPSGTADTCAPIEKIDMSGMLLRNRMRTSAVLVKREIELRFTEGRRLSEDYELWLRITRRYNGTYLVKAPLTLYHKPFFGAGGLTANQVRFEREELRTLTLLRSSNDLSLAQYAFATAVSAAKFVVRLVTIALRRLRTRSSTHHREDT